MNEVIKEVNVVRRFKKELIIAGILLGVLIFAGGCVDMNKEEYRETFSVKPGTVSEGLQQKRRYCRKQLGP